MKSKFKLSKRILSLVLAFVLVLSMMPMTSFTAFAAGASTPTVDGNLIWANGTALYIEAGTSGGTAVYYTSGSTKVYLNSNGAAGDNLSGTIIYGGYNDNALDGDVNITMTGGTVKAIRGGGYDYDNPAGGYVNNVNITITGGSVTEHVAAGWMNPVNGNVNITVTGGSVGKLYGCIFSSQQSVGSYEVRVKGNVNIVVTGGSVNQIHGGDNYNLINGTVSGIVAVPTTFYNNDLMVTDKTKNFDNILYLNGSTYVYRGQVTIPSGVTLTVASGQSMTIASGKTLINNGTLVNNGTITIKGVIQNNGTFINNETVNRNAAYCTGQHF